jgi:hypothetical protein
VAVIVAFQEEAAESAAVDDAAVPPVVSLHAIAGIWTEDTIHAHHLLALDSGSTHNFINSEVMRHL